MKVTAWYPNEDRSTKNQRIAATVPVFGQFIIYSGAGVERLRENEKCASAKVSHKGTRFFEMVALVMAAVKPTTRSGRCQVSLQGGEFAAWPREEELGRARISAALVEARF